MKESRYIMGWKSTGRYWSDASCGWVSDPRDATTFSRDEGYFRVGKWVVENNNNGGWPVQLIDINEFEGMFECPVNLNSVFLTKNDTPLIVCSLPKTKNDVIRLLGSDRELQYKVKDFLIAVKEGIFRPLWEYKHSIIPDNSTHYLKLIGAEHE